MICVKLKIVQQLLCIAIDEPWYLRRAVSRFRQWRSATSVSIAYALISIAAIRGEWHPGL
jgi:hypothetical protein